MKPVPLIRHFIAIPGDYRKSSEALDEAWLLHLGGERVQWGELQGQERVVLLADAGAGKTFELRAEAERLIERGHAAFFIRIEDIDEDFGAAFEVGDAVAFDRWLEGSGEAWFLLDSVDEVRLETPRAFEAAMRAFSSRIHDAQQRAHVIISSRPYAWRPNLDSALIDELLPSTTKRAEPVDEKETPSKHGQDAEAQPGLQLYRLAPLDEDDIRLFAGHRSVSDVGAFLAALHRTALFGLAQLPFDLDDLITTWNATGGLDSRLTVLDRGIRQRLSEHGPAEPPLSLDRALEGARCLALATTLTGDFNICLPWASGLGLDSSALLAGWSVEEIGALLSKGVFSDAIYDMVRFRHREMRELLAAQWLGNVLQRPQIRAAVEGLIFRDSYGETIIAPRLRPLLPWLILSDEGIRERALSLHPEIALEGGDPARLPFRTREEFLKNIVAGIVNKANRGGDNQQISRIAQTDLEPAVQDLLDTHFDDYDVVFFLGRMIWQGEMPSAARRLEPISLNPDRGIYARIVSTRAVASVGGYAAGDGLWAGLNERAEPLPRRLLAELLDNAPATLHSVDLLIASIDHLEPYVRFESTGLTQALHRLIERLPMTSEQAVERPLERLVDGFAGYFARPPFVQARACRVSQSHAWLMGPAMRAVERLIIGRSDATLHASALQILTSAPALGRYGDSEGREYKSKLEDLVPRWTTLNDALFWRSVTLARNEQEEGTPPLEDDWNVLVEGHYWRFDTESFTRTLSWIRDKALPEDRSVALSRTFRSYAQNGLPRPWRRALWGAVGGDADLEFKLGRLMRPPPNPSLRRWRSSGMHWNQQHKKRQARDAHARADFVARLQANPESVRSPPGLKPGEMTWDQVHLQRSIEGDGSRLSRSGGGHWEALVPEFGKAVAEAFRDAALRQWRAYLPVLGSEGANRSSIPYQLTFGMAGLEIEAGPESQGLNLLSEADTLQALRYAPWELNGFPTWFEPLFNSHRDIAIKMIWAEVLWELGAAKPDNLMHYLLHDLVYYTPWLHGRLAEPLRLWLLEHGAPNFDVLRHARAIIVGGGATPAAIAELARTRAKAAITPDDQRPLWFALWVDADPTAAIPALEGQLASLERQLATEFAEEFLANLMGDRRGAGAAIGTWRNATDLRRLYGLMHDHIRVSEDIERPSGHVFSPTSRDDAQHARSNLFNLLADLPGEETYRAIQELALHHPSVDHRQYMRRAARDRAIADGDIILTADQVRELFELADLDRHATDPSDRRARAPLA